MGFSMVLLLMSLFSLHSVYSMESRKRSWFPVKVVWLAEFDPKGLLMRKITVFRWLEVQFWLAQWLSRPFLFIFQWDWLRLVHFRFQVVEWVISFDTYGTFQHVWSYHGFMSHVVQNKRFVMSCAQFYWRKYKVQYNFDRSRDTKLLHTYTMNKKHWNWNKE